MQQPSLDADIVGLIRKYVKAPTKIKKNYIKIIISSPVSALWWPVPASELPYLQCPMLACSICPVKCGVGSTVNKWRENINLNTSKQLLAISKYCKLVKNPYYKYVPTMVKLVTEFPSYHQYLPKMLIERLDKFIICPENDKSITTLFRNPCKILLPSISMGKMGMLWQYIWEFERQDITNRIIIAAKIKGFLETGIIPISDNALLKQSFLILEEITNSEKPRLWTR